MKIVFSVLNAMQCIAVLIATVIQILYLLVSRARDIFYFQAHSWLLRIRMEYIGRETWYRYGNESLTWLFGVYLSSNFHQDNIAEYTRIPIPWMLDTDTRACL